MARVITNEEIYGVLGSIDSSMQKSLTLMKDSLAIDQRRAALAKESAERARTAEKLDSLDSQAAYDAGETTSSRPSALRSGLSMATAGGIFGNGNLLKIGLAAAAAPFALSFMKGFLFGENGIFKQATDYLSTTGLTGITDKLGSFLSNELTGTILGTLVFGKKFILFTLAQNAVTKYIEDKFGVDIPDWLQGPAGAAMSIIAASIIGAGAKRALFAVGGAALAGTLNLGKKGMVKAAITAASVIGAKQLAEKIAAKEAASAAAAAAKIGSKMDADMKGMDYKPKLPKGPDVPTKPLSPPKYDYDPKTDVYTSKKTGKELKGTARLAAERSRLARAAEAGAKPTIDTASATAAKTAAKVADKSAIEAAAKSSVKKAMLKSLPFVGALIGAGFAAERAIAGDYTTAKINAAGAALDFVPVVGTGLSIASDIASIPPEVFFETYRNAFGDKETYDPNNPAHVEHMKQVMLMIQEQLAYQSPQYKTEAERRAAAYYIKQGRSESSLFYKNIAQARVSSARIPGSEVNIASGYGTNALDSIAAQRLQQLQMSGGNGTVNVNGGATMNRGGDTINNNSSTTIVNNTYDPAKSLNTAPK